MAKTLTLQEQMEQIQKAIKSLEPIIKNIRKDGCKWECCIEVGPDGKPKVVCKIRCVF